MYVQSGSCAPHERSWDYMSPALAYTADATTLANFASTAGAGNDMGSVNAGSTRSALPRGLAAHRGAREDLLEDVRQLLHVQADVAAPHGQGRGEHLGGVALRYEDRAGRDLRVRRERAPQHLGRDAVAAEVRVRDDEDEVVVGLLRGHALHRRLDGLDGGVAARGDGAGAGHLRHDLRALHAAPGHLAEVHEGDLGPVAAVAYDAPGVLVLEALEALHDHGHRLRHAVQPAILAVEAVHRGRNVHDEAEALGLLLLVPQGHVWLHAPAVDELLARDAVDEALVVQLARGLVRHPLALPVLGLLLLQDDPQLPDLP
mmetsp:Transcript_88182/g.285431  ORF Transcript_88182/g.285431 Transcript_88182/m.285431 type:complete len:316 (-) Transcript_88182:255-1202(-)